MANELITKIKVKLQVKDRFLACIAMMIKWVEDNSIPTAGVTNTTLHYNPNWFFSLSLNEQVGLIAHECMHIALQHPARCFNGKFNTEMYNVAGDMVINRELSNNDYELPPNGLKCPYQFKDMCTEEIYKELVNQGKTPYNPLADLLPPDKEETNELKKILSNALISSKLSNSPSLRSAELQRTIQETFKPKLPWNVLLFRYLNGYKKEDYSWRLPNRRYLDIGYLPSICNTEVLTRINVYMDISGSVDNVLLDKFISELHYCYSTLKPEEIRLNYFSININYTEVITNDWKKYQGYISSDGGTSIKKVIEDINKYKACINIIFTDGMFKTKYIDDSKYPILWVIFDNKNFKPSKGKVIEINT